MSRVTLTLSAALLAGTVFVSPAKAVEVYLFKGAGDFSFINKNMHFSRGLDRIAEELNAQGIRAEVRGFAQTGEALRLIKKRRPKSVAFVGHSMGALASMSMARQMKSLGIRVAYVGTLDIPGPVGTAGGNVDWAENYFSITPIYGLLTNVSSHKKAKNIHVFGTHTTMDDSKKVRRGVIAAIRQIHAAENGGALPEPPVETIMVKDTSPPIEAKPVQTATLVKPNPVSKLEERSKPKQRKLPKIDEQPKQARLLKIDEEPEQPPAEQQPAEQQVAALTSASAINSRILQAHGEPVRSSRQKIDNPSNLEPVNLLAAPVTASFALKAPVAKVQAADLADIESPKSLAAPEQPAQAEETILVEKPAPTSKPLQTASLTPVPSETVTTPPATSRSVNRPRKVFNGGRITRAGKKLVSRISGMLKRNARRHNRRVKQQPTMDR